MKKLLSLLSSITLIGTASTSVIACGTPKAENQIDLSTIIKNKCLENFYVGQLEKPNKKQILVAIKEKNPSANKLTENDFDFTVNPTNRSATIVGNGKYKNKITLNYEISNFKRIMFKTQDNSQLTNIATILTVNKNIFINTIFDNKASKIYKSIGTDYSFKQMTGIEGIINDWTVDKDNNIYAASTNGMIYKSNNNDEFIAFKPIIGSSKINSIITNSQGNVYVGTEKNIYKSNGVDDFVALTGTSGAIYKLTVDKDDNIYAASGNSTIYKSNSNDEFSAIKTINNNDGQISSFKIDKNNNIYIGTSKSIIYKFDITNNKLNKLSGTMGNIYDFDFDNINNVYTVGTAKVGFVYKSNGVDDFVALTGISGAIYNLSIDSTNNIYAVGVIQNKATIFISEKL